MTSFVDTVTIQAVAGNGGKGCASVRREKFRPLGGPDGGNGGRGGDVVLVADLNANSLLALARRPHLRAGDGKPGQGSHRHGSDGDDAVFVVPPGTVVLGRDGGVLADLVLPGSRYPVARGGRGGLGNAALASPARKAPGFALLGEPGESREATLTLKMIADVGLVGYPSAGKSSLIAAISAARPKVADYPFTTLRPHLGVVEAGDTVFTVADVPGLIPGAASGKGLGLEFLRHIERCSILVQVVDCATIESGRDPLSDIETIESELVAYGGLEGRTRVIALNKCDIPEALELAEICRSALENLGFPIFEVSAVNRLGLRSFVFALARMVEVGRSAATDAEPSGLPMRVRPVAVNDQKFTVERVGSDGAFRISGQLPARWVRQTDFGNDEAVGYLADRLARLGVEAELSRLGAESGCTVIIGTDDDAVVFDWQPSVAAGEDASLAQGPRGHDPRLADW